MTADTPSPSRPTAHKQLTQKSFSAHKNPQRNPEEYIALPQSRKRHAIETIGREIFNIRLAIPGAAARVQGRIRDVKEAAKGIDDFPKYDDEYQSYKLERDGCCCLDQS